MTMMTRIMIMMMMIIEQTTYSSQSLLVYDSMILCGVILKQTKNISKTSDLKLILISF